MRLTALFLLFLGAAAVGASSRDKRPNFVWLHVESTDGRTYNDDMADVVPIPNIRSLKSRGAHFVNHYANIPICCPSRASVWTGRQAHNIPHTHNGIHAGGAWSNFEGLGVSNSTFDRLKISDRLEKLGYTSNIAGKEDWLSGSHSMTTMVDSLSIYSRWPYSIPEEGGFHIWGDCGGNVTVNPGNESLHKGDWKIVQTQTEWLLDPDGAAKQQPFFAYGGFGIVHPPYRTDEEHWNRIPESKVTAPHWPAFDDDAIHPCDLQTSMKKGCARTSAAAGLGYMNTTAHKTAIRRAYYAMIAEFDDMVGQYIRAVEQAGLSDSTVFVVSSDHGDMQMEHAQFYKMVAYEASTRVPLVIAGPGVNHIGDGNVLTLSSLVDLMPTFLEMAGAEPSKLAGDEAVDGTSLLPLLKHGDRAAASHPDHVISQFHGENLAMSWYMIRRAELKLVQWGTGSQHEPQLFNLTADPSEWHNLAHGYRANDGAQHPYKNLIEELDQLLRASIDYPAVTKDVARYNLQMARWWMTTEPRWQQVLEGGTAAHEQHNSYTLNPDWGQLWQEHPRRYWDAWSAWLNSTDPDEAKAPDIPPCPSTLIHSWD